MTTTSASDTLPLLPVASDPPRAAQAARAQAAWAATAHALAGNGRVRVSSDGGRTYPRSRERALPATVPDQPAAVLVYDGQGQARCLPVDLDSSRGGPEQVQQDLTRLHALLARCGAQAITDRSPNGGHHVYVPWTQPVSFHELRAVMVALAALLPSLDVLPAVNLRAGCLRPPGSRHRSGGWQELITPLPQAARIAEQGNPPAVWQALQELLTPYMGLAQTRQTGVDLTLPQVAAGGAGPHERNAHSLQLPRQQGPRPLTTETLRLAQHGEYDAQRYQSPSQARQRVHAAAAGAGWQYSDLLEQLHSGRWPGLAALYSRYRPAARPERIAADWVAAVTWLRPSPSAPAAPPIKEQSQTGEGHAHNSHTREPTTHRGDPLLTESRGGNRSFDAKGRKSGSEYQFVRTWWNSARRAERVRYSGRAGLTRRLLLRALANAAQKQGSRYVEFGCRSLSLAAGVDHSTVAAALRALRSEDDPLLVLVEDRRGVRGDLYELVVPEEFADSIGRRDWRPGRIEAISPVFRQLGLPVAFVYEQLGSLAASSFELADLALVSHRAAQQALKTLSAHGLATRNAQGGWVRGAALLAQVAEVLGVDQVIEQIHARYKVERSTWQGLLGALTPRRWHRAQHPDTQQGPQPADRPPPEPPEPEVEPETPLQLLHRVLGAVPVPSWSWERSNEPAASR